MLHTHTHTHTHSPVVPEVNMYRTGLLMEAAARKAAGTGWTGPWSSWSSREWTRGWSPSPPFFTTHTSMLSSSRLGRTSPRHAVRSGGTTTPSHDHITGCYNTAVPAHSLERSKALNMATRGALLFLQRLPREVCFASLPSVQLVESTRSLHSREGE